MTHNARMAFEMHNDGRPVLTARMAVTRYGPRYNLSPRGVRTALGRSGIPPVLINGEHPIHARIPVYDQETLDEAMARGRTPAGPHAERA